MPPGLSLEQIIHFLLDAPMFRDLNAAELSTVVHIMQVEQHEKGHHIFREGDAGDAWFLVYQGSVEVMKASKGVARQVAVLDAGSCFGEMAILDGFARSASVVARDDVTAFKFPRTEFNDLLAVGNLASYKLVHQMALVLVSRQRRTTERLVQVYEASQGQRVRRLIAPIIDQSAVAE